MRRTHEDWQRAQQSGEPIPEPPEGSDEADGGTATLEITVTGLDEDAMLEAFGGDSGSAEGVEQYFDEGMYRRFNGEHSPDARSDDFDVDVTFDSDETRKS